MPSPKVTKNEVKPKQQKPVKHEATDWWAWYGDYRYSTELSINGTRIHGHSEAVIEDGASGGTSANGAGDAELTVVLEDCDCGTLEGTITLGVRHKLYWAAALAGTTLTRISATGMAEAAGVKTNLEAELETTTVEEGSFEAENESGEKVKVDVNGNADGTIKGAKVNGKADIEFTAEDSTKTRLKRKYRSALPNADTGGVVKLTTRRRPLSCGVNTFRASSSLSLALSSAVEPKPDGTERDTDWLTSTFDFDIENDLSVIEIEVTCDGRTRKLPVPAQTVAAALPVLTLDESRVFNPPSGIAPVPRRIESVGCLGHGQDLRIQLDSSDPTVIAPISPSNVLRVGDESLEVSWVPGAPGRATVYVRIPELRYRTTRELVVRDLAEAPRALAVFPPKVELVEGGTATLTLVRSLASEIADPAEARVGWSQQGIAEAASVPAFEPGRGVAYLRIVGREAGVTDLRLRVADASHDVPVRVIPNSEVTLSEVEPFEGTVGSHGYVAARLSHAFSREVAVDVSGSALDLVEASALMVTLPAGHRTVVVPVDAMRPGAGELVLWTDFGAEAVAPVRVRPA